MIPAAKLLIGLHASQQRPQEGSHEINVTRGGPTQLLGWVENQLGLAGPSIAWTDRVVAYHLALSRNQRPSYEASFAADAWATASHLLKRRDELLMAGWDPTQPTGHPLVDDLGALEHPSFLPGIPDRINLAIRWLADGARLPPHEVHLSESQAHWPPLWQQLLGHLTCRHDAPVSRGTGALATLQSNLITGESNPARVDDSVLALRSASSHAAVQFLAQWMDGPSVTVYCPDPAMATLLDGALHANGKPTMGVPRESHRQPAQQILPLVIQLLREPVNPYVLLDFLLLPVGPVRRIGWHLARALEKQPGYQSDAWNDAVAKILADDEEDEKAGIIEKWLNHDRVPMGADVPTDLVEQLCGQVAQWTAGRARWENKRQEPNEELADALSGASSQAAALGKLAAQLGSTITGAQLQRLLDEVRSEASIDVPHVAQSGGATFVSSLADVGACDHLVWLGTHAADAATSRWTPAERRRLAEAGIKLNPEATTRTLRAAEARGLARARRLLIVDVQSIDGRRHPLWLRMHGDLLIHGERAGTLPLLESLLGGPDAPIPSRLVGPSQAPRLRVHWDVASPIPLPAATSATALEAQLSCPLKWTLRHALQLYPGTIASIPEDHLLKGNFGHELLEWVFRPGPAPSPDAAADAMGQAFDEWVPRNAATLAIPRKLAEKNQFRRQICAAARHFAEALHAGGYEVVGMELPTVGDVGGVPLAGRVDCVLRGDDGEVIVDFKLGSPARYKQKLETGRAVQLATYANGREAHVAAAAYLVLTKNQIVTPRAGPMRGANLVVDGPGMGETWARFEAALAAAGAWLAGGEVTARPLQDPADWPTGSNVVLDADRPDAACSYCDYDALCGRRQLA